jgi:hypothetical protein
MSGAETVTVAARFRGPPRSGNGGYVGGVLAGLFPDREPGAPAVEATLRAPIPLDHPLRVERAGGDPRAEGAVRLLDGDVLIAEARLSEVDVAAPEPPGIAAAEAARGASPSFLRDVNPLIPDGTGFHPVCVCCGVDVPPGEGLFVHAAPVPGFDGVAAAWRPDPAFADGRGMLPEAIVWTALDCPGQFAWYASGTRTGLLGRMTARLLAPVPADEALLVTGWTLGTERRKHFAGTALHGADGTLLAVSRQVWIGGEPVGG